MHTNIDQPRTVGYAHAAADYLRDGWKPIPIPAGAKTPPPPGTTGESGVVTAEDVSLWMVEAPLHNLALRHEQTIAIDVDGYDGKPGPDTLAALIAECGPLPSTFTSSARGTDSPSRQYFFRIPDSTLRFVTNLPGLEICQFKHRYSLVAPSVNPKTGSAYEWYKTTEDGTSGLIIDAPAVAELPMLPDAWVERLTDKSQPNTGSQVGWSGTVADWIDGLTPGDPEAHVRGRVESSTQPGVTFTTEVMHKAVGYLVGCGANGHPGVPLLLEELRDRWLTLGPEAQNGYAHYSREFDDSVKGAIRDIGPNRHTLELPEGVDPRTGEILEETPVKAPACLDDFWNRREFLGVIERNSYRLLRSPWALLGVTMMRALACVPYYVRFESYLGDASLNALFAFTAKSGSGKSIVHRNIGAMFDFGIRQDEGHLWPKTAGSDAGIADRYAAVDKTTLEWVDPLYRSLIWGFDEVVDLAASQERQGINLEGLMTKAYSGEPIGRETAGGRTQTLPQDSYRFLAYANVQPSMAGAIVNPRAVRIGFAGRWIWMNAQVDFTDETAHKYNDISPMETMRLEIPAFQRGTETDVFKIKALPEMNKAYKDFDMQRQKAQEETSEIDGHTLMTRTKVAVAFAVIDGRTHLISEDWDLAGVVMEHSIATRQTAIDAVAAVAHQEHVTFGRNRAIQQDAAAEEMEKIRDEKIRRAYARIADLLDHGRTLDGLKAKDFSAGYRAEWQAAKTLWVIEHPDDE